MAGDRCRGPLGIDTEAIVQLLLDKGANIEAKDTDGWTPLMSAAVNGHEAVVQLLLGKGANIEAKDEDGWTPLLLAAEKGHGLVAAAAA